MTTIFQTNAAAFATTREERVKAETNAVLTELDTALRNLRHYPAADDPTPAQVIAHAAEKLTVLEGWGQP